MFRLIIRQFPAELEAIFSEIWVSSNGTFYKSQQNLFKFLRSFRQVLTEFWTSSNGKKIQRAFCMFDRSFGQHSGVFRTIFQGNLDQGHFSNAPLYKYKRILEFCIAFNNFGKVLTEIWVSFKRNFEEFFQIVWKCSKETFLNPKSKLKAS